MGRPEWPAWRAELRAIMVLALPVVIQTTAQQGMIVVDQIFLGHLGTAQLGAAALANAFTNLLWFFLLGFATALDTLGSNAFGAGDRRALITWCVAASLLVTVLVLPVALGMAHGAWVGAALFAQDAHTSELMGQFCGGLIFGMWPLMWGIVLTKYLQVQNIMILPSVIAVATFLLNIGFNLALVSTLGFRGAPLATSLSRCAQFLLLAGAVWHHEWRRAKAPQEWAALGGFPKEAEEEGEADGLELGPGPCAGARGAGAVGAAAVALCPPAGPFGAIERTRDAGGARMLAPFGGRLEPAGYPQAPQPGTLAPSPFCTAEEEVGGGGGGRLWAPAPGALAAAGGGGGGCLLQGASAPGADEYMDFAAGGEVAAEAAAAPRPAAAVARWAAVVREVHAATRPRVLGRFLWLGIPGGLSMAFEAGCFDITTVMAGRLGAVNIAAHAAMLSVCTLTYLACPFALATAGAIRVGNLLGAGQPEAARRAGLLPVALSGAFMALLAAALLASRHGLGYVFSADPRVVAAIARLGVYAAAFQVSDGLMGASQGVLRGCGHQHMTAVFNFLGFWVCGALLGYLLCFRAGLGLQGLWIGLTSGDTVTAGLNLTAMSRIRWRREADAAVARLEALAQQAEEEQAILASANSESGAHAVAAAAAGKPSSSSLFWRSEQPDMGAAASDMRSVEIGGGRSGRRFGADGEELLP